MCFWSGSLQFCYPWHAIIREMLSGVSGTKGGDCYAFHSTHNDFTWRPQKGMMAFYFFLHFCNNIQHVWKRKWALTHYETTSHSHSLTTGNSRLFEITFQMVSHDSFLIWCLYQVCQTYGQRVQSGPLDNPANYEYYRKVIQFFSFYCFTKFL